MFIPAVVGPIPMCERESVRVCSVGHNLQCVCVFIDAVVGPTLMCACVIVL